MKRFDSLIDKDYGIVWVMLATIVNFIIAIPMVTVVLIFSISIWICEFIFLLLGLVIKLVEKILKL